MSYVYDSVIGVHTVLFILSYAAFDLFGSDTPGTPVYHAGLERSPVGHGYDAYLCTAFPDGAAFPAGETPSITLTCTNGSLPENLRIGDIRTPESGIPATVSFSNITPVHPGVPPPLGPVSRSSSAHAAWSGSPRSCKYHGCWGQYRKVYFPIFMNLACSITEQDERLVNILELIKIEDEICSKQCRSAIVGATDEETGNNLPRPGSEAWFMMHRTEKDNIYQQ